MPTPTLMSWDRKSKRWMKWWKPKNGKGTTVSVSPKQLGSEECTEEATRKLANEWWIRKEIELDQHAKATALAIDPTSPHGLILGSISLQKEMLDAVPAERRLEMVLNGSHLGMKLQHTLHHALSSGINLNLTELLFGDKASANFGKVQSESALPSQSLKFQHKTLNEAMVAKFDAQVKAGRDPKPSYARIDGYRMQVEAFLNWHKADHVATITTETVRGYHKHLTESGFSPATCKGRMVSFRKFVSYLAEHGVITAPCNLRSKDYTFEDVGDRSHIPLDALRKMIANAPDQLKCYMLCMLNTGGYQSDVADFRTTDIEGNTIKRIRHKTRNLKNPPTVTYPLWPATLELMVKYQAPANSKNYLFLTERGTPLVAPAESKTRSDNIRVLWTRFVEAYPPAGNYQLKQLRKTGSQFIEDYMDGEYSHLVKFYRAEHSLSTEERSYVNKNMRKLGEVVNALGEAVLGS